MPVLFMSNRIERIQLIPIFVLLKNGCVAQLNRAFDYESKGFRFES